MPDFRRLRVPGGCFFFTVTFWSGAATRCSPIASISCGNPCGVSGERGIWQRRFWEHTVRDDADYAAHMDSVPFNPVKHGLVASAADWPYSTFTSCVARGLYPENWGGEGVKDVEAGKPGG